MEDAKDRDPAASPHPLEDETDATLSRLLGSNLQAATLRMALYIVVLSAVVATISSLI